MSESERGSRGCGCQVVLLGQGIAILPCRAHKRPLLATISAGDHTPVATPPRKPTQAQA